MLVVEADPTHPAHYARCKIEPLEYIIKNNLGFCEGNIIKYVTRWKNKNGVEDLQKAKYYLERLISDVCSVNAGSDYTLKCTELESGTMHITKVKPEDGERYA